MGDRHETVIIGGGQAGLAMSYYLRENGREHVILERTRNAERWHSERWDSLYFQFPNWSLQLPGYKYRGDNPDGFAHRTEVARFIEDYAKFIDAPVQCGVEVLSLEALPNSGFRLVTGDASIEAKQVVIATGPFQGPQVPQFATALPAHIFQIHASHYFNSKQLPSGAVLIVGSGSSGCQIAEELLTEGRTVYLCVGRHRRIPRTYRTRDLLHWLYAIGSFEQTIDRFSDGHHPPPILLTGAGGGHTVDLRMLGRDGVVLLGKLQSISGSKLSFDDSLESVLAAGDQSFAEFQRSVDKYISKTSLDLPMDDDSPPAAPAHSPPEIDLNSAGVSTVIWCTGYQLDFSWVKLPILDYRGHPLQKRGVTDCRGLYFLGLHWMHTYTSGTLFGVGDDAAHIMKNMTKDLPR